MLAVFWLAFSTLGIGLILWIALPSSGAGLIWLNAGLLGLLLNPGLRLAWTLASALRQRDWLLLLATLDRLRDPRRADVARRRRFVVVTLSGGLRPGIPLMLAALSLAGAQIG